jgi:hypothetical protein
MPAIHRSFLDATLRRPEPSDILAAGIAFFLGVILLVIGYAVGLFQAFPFSLVLGLVFGSGLSAVGVSFHQSPRAFLTLMGAALFVFWLAALLISVL